MLNHSGTTLSQACPRTVSFWVLYGFLVMLRSSQWMTKFPSGPEVDVMDERAFQTKIGPNSSNREKFQSAVQN